jgi:hypothetical protein
VPNFPDPASDGVVPKDRITPLVNSPQFGIAFKACQRLMPANGLGPANTGPSPHTRFVAGMAFARCVRQHGFPSFPDPTRSGELTPQMIANAGINLHQEAVLKAGDACVSVTHGAITKATVARVVAGQ